jgi:hypothetical protein
MVSWFYGFLVLWVSWFYDFFISSRKRCISQQQKAFNINTFNINNLDSYFSVFFRFSDKMSDDKKQPKDTIDVNPPKENVPPKENIIDQEEFCWYVDFRDGEGEDFQRWTFKHANKSEADSRYQKVLCDAFTILQKSEAFVNEKRSELRKSNPDLFPLLQFDEDAQLIGLIHGTWTDKQWDAVISFLDNNNDDCIVDFHFQEMPLD